MRRNIKAVPVLDQDGNQLYTIPRIDASSFVSTGLAFVVDNRAIRFLDKGPKKSCPTASALGVADMEGLAGAETISPQRKERFVGWRL